MSKVDFIDRISIVVRAGHGGSGSRHFRRERFVPKGGPDGGDGGRGGHVILQGNSHLSTLLDFRYQKHAFAPKGGMGARNQRRGADGEDLTLPIPLGTIIKYDEKVQGEVTGHGESFILARGGRGGLGNTHFKSAKNQAPQYAQSGEPGEEHIVTLELKLIGDIGLVGAPNAGKSTLLSVLSAARPKIADYPFTTLVPNLGVVSYKPQKTFVMVDVPGLIAGAAQGKGLGLQFLRHIERTKVLLFMVPIDVEDIMQSYRMLQKELLTHNPALMQKKYLLAITKVDLVDEELLQDILGTLPANCDHVCLSSLQHRGMDSLKEALWNLLATYPKSPHLFI